MKKYKVELTTFTKQTVFFEIEAKDRESLDELLSQNCIEDLGVCVGEEMPEWYSETIGSIEEVKKIKKDIDF